MTVVDLPSLNQQSTCVPFNLADMLSINIVDIRGSFEILKNENKVGFSNSGVWLLASPSDEMIRASGR